MSLDAFVRKWTHPDYAPDAVAPAALEQAEARLGCRFPPAYREAVLGTGLPRPTIALLSSIVDRELDIADVSNFFDPAEIVETTEGWRELGLPEHLIAFAGDCSGNLFAFDRRTASDAESPVWLFDHDFGTVRKVADSFTDWIAAFCAIDPVEADD
ncbi:SMI1/KNR4 family protein [Caulobacter sp. 17J80-11]|uniref:SMI1/KNR4 family protein n=1 Tax=Caulobacter sp. 17J80-11 TaxID=2763502 RepID=UPI001653BEDE|nr:SMI1/KNR4 family protein [Caulobacter sp. 17J80-11]MBC6982097.1 SMI1/KNR4 family protein [Caulobacter sp. 17J80-11]